MTISTLLMVTVLSLGQGVVEVDPPDLGRKADQFGRELLVDGRVALYQFHPGRDFDEIVLKETDVILRLPPNLRFRKAPSQHVVRAQGTLVKEGRQVYFDVRSLQLLPEDAERLRAGLAALPAGELTRRRAWADWAGRRGRIYQDEELRRKAVELQTEILWTESDRPENRSPSATLALARRGREARLIEPVPSALAHRALLAERRTAQSAGDFAALAGRIKEFFPDSTKPIGKGPAAFEDWLARYKESGASAYRQAPAEVRSALDRWLLAETIEAELTARMAADPASGLDLAAQASIALPERQALAKGFRDAGLRAAASDVGRLRQNEALDLARTFEESGQKEKGRQVVSDWLDFQRRERLAPGDAEGRVNLAEKYLNLIQDRATALILLREAVSIDAQSQPARELFRRLGYRQQDGVWIENAAATAAASAPPGADEGGRIGDTDPLLGLTPAEVEARLGLPDRKSQVVTQGTVILQWVYGTGQRNVQYINFLRRIGSPPTVVGRYTNP